MKCLPFTCYETVSQKTCSQKMSSLYEFAGCSDNGLQNMYNKFICITTCTWKRDDVNDVMVVYFLCDLNSHPQL